MHELTIIVLVATSYVATNIDNLIILVSYMLSGRVSLAAIAGGYAIATAAVLTISVILGLSSNFMPVGVIGYLGIAPIGLGVYLLIAQFKGESEQADTGTNNAAAVGIGLTLTGNSADSILIFAPLLADSKTTIDFYIASTFIGVAAAWFWIARIASQRAAKLKTVQKLAGWVAPFIMIGAGTYILMNTATDVL